jgi:hypothetical protein
MNDSKSEPVTRASHIPPAEMHILSLIYNRVKTTPKDGQWRIFTGTLYVKAIPFKVTLSYLLDREIFKIRETSIKKCVLTEN